MSRQRVVSRVYDRVNRRLNTTAVVGTPTVRATDDWRDEPGIWEAVYDEATNTIRVINV